MQGALEQLLEADIDHELILGALNIIQKEKLESDKLFVILENFVVSHEDIGVQEKALEVLLISA